MAAAELEVVVVAEEEVAVVVDITAHLGGTASTANQLTRSASPVRLSRLLAGALIIQLPERSFFQRGL